MRKNLTMNEYFSQVKFPTSNSSAVVARFVNTNLKAQYQTGSTLRKKSK